MFSLFAVVLVALVAAKAAAVAVVAQVTNPIHSENTHGEVPAPTPGPAIAKAGLRRENGIFRRALSLNTCGYVDRVENFAIYCESGLDCAYFPVNPLDFSSFGIGGAATAAAGCCTTNAGGVIWSECMPATSCADYNRRRYDGIDSTTIGLNVYCNIGSGQQKCATWQFQGLGSVPPNFGTSSFPGYSSEVAETYTHLFCTDVSTIELVYHTFTTSYDFSSSSSSSSSSSAPQGGSLQSSTASTPASSHSSSPSPDHSGSSSNVGIIAGATVGGVVAIALIGAIVGYLVFRKKNEHPILSREVSQWDGSTMGRISATPKDARYSGY